MISGVNITLHPSLIKDLLDGRVSYSQYSMWSSCPQQYKLNYIDKLGESSGTFTQYLV